MTISHPDATTAGRAQLSTRVGGMRCALCAGVVERALREQSGVHGVAVSVPGTADVSARSSSADPGGRDG